MSAGGAGRGAGSVTALGMLVPDLEQAVAVFGAIGYTELERGAPNHGEDGRLLRTARLGLDHGPDLVLEQLDDAAARPLLPHWGLDSHPCWYVDEIEPAVAFLRERGMATENAVMDRFGPEAGEASTYIHFPSPWGMDLELISNPNPIAYEAGAEALLWHPDRPETWVEPPVGAAPAPARTLPSNRGTVHMGMRVPDLAEAIEFFTVNLGCELLYHHPPMQRSGGRWVEIPAAGEPPEPDRSVPDERFPHGTRIRVCYLRCADFNFEPMELTVPDEDGAMRPVYDPAAALVMHPVFAVDSVADAAAELERAGAVPDRALPGTERWLAPWGQAIGLAPRR